MKRILLVVAVFILPSMAFAGKGNLSTYGLAQFIADEVSAATPKYAQNPAKLIVLKIARELKDLEYQEDKANYAKSFEEVKRDGGGDCEDLTIYALCRLAEEGFPKQDMGFHIYYWRHKDAGHCEPLVWIGGECHILSSSGLANAYREMNSDRKNIEAILFRRGFPLKRLRQTFYRNWERRYYVNVGMYKE